MHQLIAPRLLDPQWFNLVRYGAEGQAKDEQSVMVEGEVLKMADPGAKRLIPGERVHVRLRGVHFGMETQSERDEYMHSLEVLRGQRESERKRQLNALREEAESFNATIHVPAQWRSGMKDVLSGLSEKSDGTGMNAATVTHIWLQEDLYAGRLQRHKGDFLCTSASGSNGKQWSAVSSAVSDERMDGDHNRYQAKVTCKSCLKIAARYVDTFCRG